VDREPARAWAHPRASFIPPAPIRDLRDLTRHRKSPGDRVENQALQTPSSYAVVYLLQSTTHAVNIGFALMSGVAVIRPFFPADIHLLGEELSLV